MADFDLYNFLSNYKPKKNDLLPYLKCSKLKNYHVLKKNSDLILHKTYVKYIKECDPFQDKKLNDHIKSGGILIAGGTFEKNFKKSEDHKKWS